MSDSPIPVPPAPPPQRPPQGDPLFSDGAERDYRGLRAGWRLAIYILALFAVGLVFSLIGRWFTAHGHPPAPGPKGLLIGEILFFLTCFLPAWGLGRLERRTPGDFGLPARGAFGINFWNGLAWGLLALTALLLLIKASGDFDFGAQSLHGETVWKYAVAWGAVFLAVGFAEEFSFRGYSLATLAQGIGFWPAAALLSIGFGAIHLGNTGEDWVGALSAGLIGFFFCFTLRLSGSLWFAIGMHAGWDWAETYLFGVPDSGLTAPGQLMHPLFHGSPWITGGSVGPEGSLWVLVVIGLLFPIYWRLGPRRQAT